jgi:hypothetical protein
VEGIHEPLISNWLFDHGARMVERWRAFLFAKYQTPVQLQEAHADKRACFENSMPPTDRLRKAMPEVAALPYWQPARDNQPLRDYLELTAQLFHEGFRALASAMRQATPRKRVLLYDCLKMPMMGWENRGFFEPAAPWPIAFPEQLSGSGHMNVSRLFDAEGFDGLITPHDYQLRGVNGVYEPEGAADSAVLRGKLFLSEMDTRTYCGSDHYGRAENDREFAAITWRNLATSITRGFTSYWMDLHQDWFATDAIHAIIERQAKVLREAADWNHATVPGIAMILDDQAMAETNGNGGVLNELVMWEQKLGLSRCGVPYRIYLLEDLELEHFPDHRVFYFPNLYRAEASRLKLLQQRVFKDGRYVVWGPGCGISDGRRIAPENATGLTGFTYEMLAANYPRRTLITNFDHPLTRSLPADTCFGSPLSYGPLLFPTDGTTLGLAVTKQNRNYAGLAIKQMPGWTSIVSTCGPLPASLWREIARQAGAHIYSEENDVVLADSSVLAIHTAKPGQKRLTLPGARSVVDLITGQSLSPSAPQLEFAMTAPETRLFLLDDPYKQR